MFIKKLFILIMLALVPSIIFGMDASSPATKRAKADLMEQAGLGDLEGLDLSFDEDFHLWLSDLKLYIGNFDVAGVRAQLASDEVLKISDEDRGALHAGAVQRRELIFKMCRAAQEITIDTTNDMILEKFTFGEFFKPAKQIENLLQALKLMKKFKFPQVHFNPQPYNTNDPQVSLESILETLIMNEQKGISVSCFHLTLYNIAKHLVDQKNEGVHIEVVTNQTQGNTAPLQGLKHIVDNGIVLMAPKNKTYETNHHKFFIFTSNVLSKPLVWNGSYNATGNSNSNSWEDVTILGDADVIQRFRGRFEQIKAASQPITQDELANARTNPSQWSLSINKVPDELRK